MDARSSQREQRPGLMSGLWKFVRQLIVLSVIAAVGVAAAWYYLKQRVHEEIRAFVEAKFAEHYAQNGLSVSVGSARLIEGQRIEIRDFSIYDASGASRDELAHIDELLAPCDATMQDLISGPPKLKHITARHIKVRTVRQADGSWSATRLCPFPSFGTRPPDITIDGGTVEVVDATTDPPRTTTFRDIHLEITNVDRDRDTRASSSLPTERRVRGWLTGDNVRRIDVDGLYDMDTMQWSAQGTAHDVDISPALRQSLPGELASRLGELASLRARATLDFEVASSDASEKSEQPLTFAISGKVNDGRIDDPRLPYPLTDIQANVQCNNDELKITGVTARCGLGTIELSCHRQGYQRDSPLVLRAGARQVILNRRLAEVLPADVQRVWELFSPTGKVNADLTLTFDGHGWKPDLLVECLDVSFAYNRFPYRARGCIGTIHLQDTICTVDLQAFIGGRIVYIDGEIQNPGEDFTGGVDISVEGPIPIDEELLTALEDEQEELIRSFRPKGEFTFTGRIGRTDPQQELAQHLVFELHDCSVRYKYFPYPFERLRGTIELIDGQWKFSNLEGRNGTAFVVCNGQWTDSAGGGQLKLDFVGTSIPLEDELRLALNSDARAVWSDLRPQGTIDHLKVALRYTAEEQRMSLDIEAQKWPQRDEVEGRSITVHPIWFPYRLDDVTGKFFYRDGAVTFKNVAGNHGNTKVTLQGECNFARDRWHVLLNRLTASRLRADHDLISALPDGLKQAVANLNLTGLLSLEGSIGFYGNSANDAMRSNWDVYVDVENGDLNCGILLNDIHGGIQLIGEYDGQTYYSRGWLNVDSVIFREVQLTKVAGPVWIDPSQVAFGGWAPPAQRGGKSQQVTAQLFGGNLAGDALILLDGDMPFRLQYTLSDGDLPRFSQEVAPRMGNVAGKMYAAVKLSGNSTGTHTWRGDGAVRLREADIYEVPAMIALLKLLSIRRPDRTAFTSSDMDFYIEGEDIYFDRIDFNGDAISLKGTGWADMDGQIDLKFYTIMGRDEFYIPIVRPLLGIASQQFLLIEMNGTIDNPNPPTRKVLPGLNETLQQLFPEIAERRALSGQSSLRPLEALRRTGISPRR